MAPRTPRTPATPPVLLSGSGSGTGGSSRGSSYTPPLAARFKAAAATIFVMPSGIQLAVLSGPNWPTWSGIFSALLQLNQVDDILTYNACPKGVDTDDWSSVQKKTQAYLRLYCTMDVYSTVE